MVGEILVLAWVPSLASQIMAADENGNDLIPSLLTGGGFVFLAALMAGLFLINKNQSDAAKAIADGSTTLVAGMRIELDACQRGFGELRTATEKLANGFDTLMTRARPSNGHEVTVTVTKVEFNEIMASIREARKHLN